MKEIVYYAVTFDKGLIISPLMTNRNFEKWQDAKKYLNETMDKAKEKCREYQRAEETISDYAKECPFEKEYEYTRQMTTLDALGWSRIYCGQVRKKYLRLI